MLRLVFYRYVRRESDVVTADNHGPVDPRYKQDWRPHDSRAWESVEPKPQGRGDGVASPWSRAAA